MVHPQASNAGLICFFKSYNNTRTMEMQIYAMDACFQIGQGGRKESDGPKG